MSMQQVAWFINTIHFFHFLHASYVNMEQKHMCAQEHVHINEVIWYWQYEIKNQTIHKVNQGYQDSTKWFYRWTDRQTGRQMINNISNILNVKQYWTKYNHSSPMMEYYHHTTWKLSLFNGKMLSKWWSV